MTTKSVNATSTNDNTNSNLTSLSNLLATFSQLQIESKRKAEQIEEQSKELRRINERLERAATAIQDFTEKRVLVHTAEIDLTTESRAQIQDRLYHALIPKKRVSYSNQYHVRPLQHLPSKGTLVVILNKYRSATDGLQQQGLIGVIRWTDHKHIGVTVSPTCTYKKQWSSCGQIDPQRVEYEKEYPVSSELWERLTK